MLISERLIRLLLQSVDDQVLHVKSDAAHLSALLLQPLELLRGQLGISSILRTSSIGGGGRSCVQLQIHLNGCPRCLQDSSHEVTQLYLMGMPNGMTHCCIHTGCNSPPAIVVDDAIFFTRRVGVLLSLKNSTQHCYQFKSISHCAGPPDVCLHWPCRPQFHESNKETPAGSGKIN